jgi:hypothetical protein
VTKKFFILPLALVAALAVGCSKSDETANANANPGEATTKPAPDNSEITTSVRADGTKTETRVFHNNPRLSKIVVTTSKDGKKTVKAYSPSGEERDVPQNENVLEEAGGAIADSAGFVADKAEDAAGVAKDKTQQVGEKTVEGAKAVGDKTVEGTKAAVAGTKAVGSKVGEGAKTVGSKTVEGTKKVGEAAASGAKKAGSAVKKVIP